MFIIYFEIKILMTHNIFFFIFSILNYDIPNGWRKKKKKLLMYVSTAYILLSLLFSLCHLFNEKENHFFVLNYIWPTRKEEKKRVFI
jgi:hypothetical protein